ncbi:hypothetical protein PV08_09932 [Exophiala spinifera]|uniref:WSC domain-containing protein n=1 Tax=Exophiala spinifera TaxID=91928 RepID=A0A0D2BNE5_9EURO|nr:uncharacterized protein PV08_09932 [Exophiala spinifera]KIW12654.1 hypothetical protein PV08_09932 [Exophiala spinifera]
MLTSILLVSLALGVQTLEVTSGSACADICEGPTLTYSDDLTCTDEGYFNTAKGDTMHDCLLCESKSTANTGDNSNPQNNDIYWFLFNMKYTLQYCMFQGNGSTPNLPQCQASCAGLYPVLQSSWFIPVAAEQYDYCSINNTAFPPTWRIAQPACHDDPVRSFLAISGCDNKPNATFGQTISLERDLFETATPSSSSTGTLPAASATGASGSSSSTNAASAAVSATQASPTPSTSSSGLSGGAAAGIGVGCGLAAIAAVGGLGWFIVRRRRSRRAMAASSDFLDTKRAYMTPPYQYAQQIDGSEVHEIDSGQVKSGAAGSRTELE